MKNTSISCEDFSFFSFFLRCLPVNNISAASETSGVSMTDEVLLNSGHVILARIISRTTEYLRKDIGPVYKKMRETQKEGRFRFGLSDVNVQSPHFLLLRRVMRDARSSVSLNISVRHSIRRRTNLLRKQQNSALRSVSTQENKHRVGSDWTLFHLVLST